MEDLNLSRLPERVASQIKDNVNFTNITAVNLVSQIPYYNIAKLTSVRQE